MELSDLFVSHKQVEPVHFDFKKPEDPQPIYLNLERAKQVANPDAEKENDPETEDMSTWSVDGSQQNWSVESTHNTPEPAPVKHVPTKPGSSPLTSTNLYNWISRFERSKDFGGSLSSDDLKGIDYKDANGHRTFGYGLLYHPNGNYMDQVKSEWTQTELEQLYKQTVDNTRNKVLKWAKSKNIALEDNQIDALTSAVYNFGPRFLEWSVARRIAANPNDEKIYEAWAKFSDHQADKYPGLVKRRKKEADRYFNRA